MFLAGSWREMADLLLASISSLLILFDTEKHHTWKKLCTIFVGRHSIRIVLNKASENRRVQSVTHTHKNLKCPIWCIHVADVVELSMLSTCKSRTQDSSIDVVFETSIGFYSQIFISSFIGLLIKCGKYRQMTFH